jgi:hypothetical protein
VYGREFTLPDPNGKHEWDTVQDVKRIWTKSGYSDFNCVIINNELRKIDEFSQNSIIIPSFERKNVLEQSDLLAKLKVYLNDLIVNNPSDVKEYLRSHPLVLVQDEEHEVHSDQMNFELKMSFERCENGNIFYSSFYNGDKYTVRLQNTNDVYTNQMPLFQILELGKGEHFLYKNGNDFPYSLEDCAKFLTEKK